MSRARFRVVGLVGTVALAVALVAAAGFATGLDSHDTGGPGVDVASDESLYVSPPPDEVTREEYTQTGIDVSAAAATDSEALRGRYDRAAFQQRFDTADDRLALVEQVAGALGERTATLDGRHADILRAYGEGEYSTQRLLRELAQVNAAAVESQRLRDRMRAVVNSADDIELTDTLRKQFLALDAEIPTLESPVVDGYAADVEPGATVYTQATPDALVLASAGSTHVRRTTLRAERDRDGPNQFIQAADEGENANGLALDRAREIYGEQQVGGLLFPRLNATTVYGIQGSTAAGEFISYLDGATKNRFHERWLLDATAVPTAATLTDTAGGLKLAVETTIPTGPMRVSVTDGGDPVTGVTLSVMNTTVGTTDATGGHWVTQPLGGAELTATVDGETLRVTVPG